MQLVYICKNLLGLTHYEERHGAPTNGNGDITDITEDYNNVERRLRKYVRLKTRLKCVAHNMMNKMKNPKHHETSTISKEKHE